LPRLLDGSRQQRGVPLKLPTVPDAAPKWKKPPEEHWRRGERT
jgi:hypothetical protein